ncbi:hypothetical protein N1851_026904 [Merluccius polli]|uniref:Uncharacterized protein n=1 Tax=Merluccius polli TaxID=89951 RepID=A0AA47NUQ6_MERPO|nr:hypothetical protein N1851_026904 [Merluccius polli]
MVQREIRKAEEERQRVKAVAMNKEGSWTRWESVREKGTDLAEHLDHGRTPDQVSAVFHSSRAGGKFWWQPDQILTQLAAGVEQARKKLKQFSKYPLSQGRGESSSRDEEQRGPGHSK